MPHMSSPLRHQHMAIAALFALLLPLSALAQGASESYDVAVSGGGPAGMLAALQLAERGLKVAVIEKRGEARSRDQKLGLKPATVKLLGELGVEIPQQYRVRKYMRFDGDGSYRMSSERKPLASAQLHPIERMASNDSLAYIPTKRLEALCARAAEYADDSCLRLACEFEEAASALENGRPPDAIVERMRTTKAKVDTTGIQRCQGAELLRDNER